MEVFTDEWASACCQALNASEGYRASSAGWQGAIVLAMGADAEHGIHAERRVYIDAHQGACRGARIAADDDVAAAPYLLRADPATWKRLLARELEPVAAVMQGKLKLVRGNFFVLAKYAQSAREMVAAAATVGGRFPADGGS